MKKLVRILILTAVSGLFALSTGMVYHAEAQTVPISVARICMQNTFNQRIDLRVYSASGEAGPADVFLVNGIYDLGFTCQDPPTSFWPVHGSIVAKGDAWDSTNLDKFRLNFEAGSIAPEAEAGCTKFKYGLTCRADENHPGKDKNKEDKKQLAVSCEGFFTNLGLQEGNFTASDSWTPVACFEWDADESQQVSPPSGSMPGAMNP